MSKAFPNRTNTPPGGWIFQVPETGKTIGPLNTFSQLHSQLAGHYHAAGYEMPADIFERVQKQICDAQPEYCGEPAPNVIVKAFKETRHTFHAALQCLVTLVSHRAGSGERPALEQQEKRAQVCIACPKNSEIQPCSICNIKSLQSLILKLVGAKKTSVDARLKFCEVCHCANAAKIATKHEAIWNHLPKSQKEQLPPECWIVTEAAEKETKYDSAV